MWTIVITGSAHDGIQRPKQLFYHLQTKGLGKLKYFIGIEVAQSNVLSSDSSHKEETSMLDGKPIDTPIDPMLNTYHE